ncbi:MAG: LysM peptidoglycan-binding domain-containing protein [Chloroflexi bacterium]|nr:LysM peptidoglycan-binding domain-containing protein [Chloroflexota bacterium]
MASPWDLPQRSPVERPWMGMAMLVTIPVIALILVRMLWSGSSLWFLSVGIILLGAAAVFFLVRRPQGLEYDRSTLGHEETNRAPLILAGLGVLFLAMLLVPNFAGGGSDSSVAVPQPSGASLTSDVSEIVESPLVQEPPLVEQIAPPPAEDVLTSDETYVVQSGDTVWDIAGRFGTTVEAILEANELLNPAELQLGQELIIPAPADEDESVE